MKGKIELVGDFLRMKGLKSALSMRFLEVSTPFLGTIYDCSVCMLDRKTYGLFGLRGEGGGVE